MLLYLGEPSSSSFFTPFAMPFPMTRFAVKITLAGLQKVAIE